MVASIRPSTTRAVWARRRGRLRAAILKDTRLRRALKTIMSRPAPKTARRTHMSCIVGTPKRLSILLAPPVLLVVRDVAIAHQDRAVGAGRDDRVVGDEDEGLALLPV